MNRDIRTQGNNQDLGLETQEETEDCKRVIEDRKMNDMNITERSVRKQRS